MRQCTSGNGNVLWTGLTLSGNYGDYYNNILVLQKTAQIVKLHERAGEEEVNSVAKII